VEALRAILENEPLYLGPRALGFEWDRLGDFGSSGQERIETWKTMLNSGVLTYIKQPRKPFRLGLGPLYEKLGTSCSRAGVPRS